MTLERPQEARTSAGAIAYEVLGSGPPVVLVHGTPSRARVWRRVADRLSARRSVYLFDLLGFGASERHVEQDVSIATHACVLAELIEHWGLEHPAVVGHDIGGATVLRAHLIEGASFSRIALLDAVVLSPWLTPRTRQMQRELERYRSLPDPALETTVRRHLETATARPLHPDVFAGLFDQWQGAEGQALYLRNVGCLREADTEVFEPLLPSLSVPVLVLWGEQDEWLPVATSERIAARIPGAERVVIPGAGHFCMEDEPDLVTERLEAFLH